MVVTSSIIQFNTNDIKRALDTKITEFSSDGYYDYLPFPSYTFELPANEGPFWKRDSLVVKWDYSEPLNNLIPISNIYLVNALTETPIKSNVETNIKNINWTIPYWTELNTNYYFKISTMFEGEEIYATSSTFTVDERYIDITTNAPFVPIVANEGNKFTIDWNGHGTSDYVKIEMLGSLEQHEIIIDEPLGRLIGKEKDKGKGKGKGEDKGNGKNGGDPPNPVVIKVIEPKKYVGNNNTYTWTVDDIPYDVQSVRLKIIDSLHPYTYDYTPPIELKVPYIGIKNFMGKRIGEAIVSEVTYSGVSDALLTVYGFEPSDRVVEQGSSLKFLYNSTNAIQVYLTKESKPNYSVVLPKLDGTYTITNIQESDVFTVNAKDANNGVRMATFNVESFIEQTINETDITKFTLLELLNHCVGLGEEALTSGDALIEPGATIISKINYYKTEASQMTEGTDYGIVKQLLTHVNDDIIVVLFNGVETPPRVYLGPGDLWNRVVSANIEISKRLIIDPLVSITVSGKITSGSAPIAGVKIHFDSEGGDTETLADGTYTKVLPASYSGTATPSRNGYTFTPIDKEYENLTINLIKQDYTAKSVNVPPEFSISTATLPNGHPGVSYSAKLKAIGGTPPYSWTKYSGHLPPELSLSTGGLISGTILNNVEPGTPYTAIYQVEDTEGATVRKTLQIKINVRIKR